MSIKNILLKRICPLLLQIIKKIKIIFYLMVNFFGSKHGELNHEEVESAILRHIPKDTFELNVIINKLGEPKEYLFC